MLYLCVHEYVELYIFMYISFQAMLIDRHIHALKKVIRHYEKGFVSFTLYLTLLSNNL